MYEYVLPFIREELGRGVTNVALVRLKSTKQLGSAEEQTAALIESVTEWVNSTGAGHDCWTESSDDINIGDLSVYKDAFCDWLRGSKQVLSDVEFIWIGPVSGSMYYDRRLRGLEE